ncbi:hypothetical protein [Saccharicrinis sp. GN24d3]|uniref:hypothetical protein n=1 Tax=Saccharicrinis sp. GN24d3 TaxID=3458416 RepID=UPI004035F8E8
MITRAKKKKILLVSNGFYPEISPRSFRATELAKEFHRQGHHVTVISKFRDFDYKEFLETYPITFKMWKKPVFPTVPEFNTKLLSKLAKGIARLLSVFLEYPGIEEMFRVKSMLKNESGYDLVISFAVPYPVQWGVGLSRTKKHMIGNIWVADCGDPYMGDVLDSFRKPFYFGYLEKQFCKKADFISIPVESAKEAYYSEFHDKIKIIPQGFSFDLNKLNGKTAQNKVPEFAYAGGFLQGIRDPRPLLELLSQIDLPFRLHIFTNQEELLADYKEALSGKLLISDYIPRDELMEKLGGMDFLLNFDNNTQLNVPSKLIDYAITGRPVLNITKGLKMEEVLAFLNKEYAGRMPLPHPEKYHITNVSGQFLELIK